MLAPYLGLDNQAFPKTDKVVAIPLDGKGKLLDRIGFRRPNHVEAIRLVLLYGTDEGQHMVTIRHAVGEIERFGILRKRERPFPDPLRPAIAQALHPRYQARLVHSFSPDEPLR